MINSGRFLSTYLNKLVPTRGDKDWVSRVWRESDSGDPFRVTFLGKGEFAFSKSVPQLDRLVTGRRNDLTVIWGEANRENIIGVSNKTTGGLSGSDIPKTKSLV
jgi:hypothetical protein